MTSKELACLIDEMRMSQFRIEQLLEKPNATARTLAAGALDEALRIAENEASKRCCAFYGGVYSRTPRQTLHERRRTN
jgi:hypothetical protein